MYALGIALVLLHCHAALPETVSAQKLFPAQYVHQTFSAREGLPDAVVRALEQTKDGYLWVGTSSGLARFDGARFDVFDSGNTEAIENNDIRALVQTRDGALWIGTFGGGLVRMAEGRFTLFTTADGLPHDVIYGLAEDRQGSLWIGTGGGVSRLKDGVFTNYPQAGIPTPSRVRPLAIDQRGRVWAGSFGSGVLQLEGDEFRAFDRNPELGSEIVLALHASRGDTLWIGTYGGGLARWTGAELRRYTSADGLPDERISDVVAGPEGQVWLGTLDNGVLRFHDGTVEPLLPGSELSRLGVLALMVDGEGTLWVGTSGGGLHAVRSATFSTVPAPEGSRTQRAFSVDPVPGGGAWIGFEGSGAGLWKGGYTRVVTTATGLPSNDIVSVLRDRAGTLWLGSFGGGVTRLRDGDVRSFGSEAGAATIVFSLMESRAGDLWIGTAEQGLIRYRNGGFTRFTSESGLGEDGVHVTLEDRQGRIWAGTTGGGLSRLDGDAFTTFTTADGLPADIVRGLYEDAEGALWIGTKGGGLARYRNGSFFTFTEAHGLGESNISAVVEDDDGYLWLCTPSRLLRVSRIHLSRIADGAADRARPVRFGPADGIAAGGCSDGSHPSAARAMDGRLWFATGAGAVSVHPRAIRHDSTPPQVHIERVTARDERLQVNPGRNRLPLGSRDVEIRYTAIEFWTPRELRFRFRLDGYDDHWVEVGSRRIASYTNLPPGEYRFRVAAADRAGIWSESESSFAFVVPPRFYETWSFLLLAVVLTGAAILLAHRLHVASLEARRRELQSVVAERTAELMQSQDQLRQAHKMEAVGRLAGGVAHDFNNLLTAIKGNCELMRDSLGPSDPLGSDVQEIEGAADRAAELTQQLLAFSRKQLLRPRRLDLNEVVNRVYPLLRRVIRADIDLSTRLASGLGQVEADAGQIEQVLMNLVVNARDALPEGGAVTISTDNVPLERDAPVVGEAEVRPGSYVCLGVSDNGSGIDPELQSKVFEPFFTTKEQGKGTGLGLATVHGIVAQSGGYVRIESAPDRGTRIDVLLPRVDSPATAETGEPGPPAQKQQQRRRVLIAEDDPAVRRFITRVLERHGFVLLVGGDGEEALRVAENTPGEIDLLITDVIMPGMNGKELADRLRQRRPELPVLFISGYTADVLQGRGVGPNEGFLSKPFSVEQLEQRVNEIFRSTATADSTDQRT